MIDIECRKCRHSVYMNYNTKWRVVTWYCRIFKETVPEYIVIINCPGFEEYESDIHDNDAARPNPQTRDNGIHQEE